MPRRSRNWAAKCKWRGRLVSLRRMGQLSFASLQDGSGRIQLMLSRAAMGEEQFAETAGMDLGDILWARGVMMRTRSGELSVEVNELALLTKALRPLPEKFHGLTDREQRYRRRYVDLIVNRDSREVFERRSRVISALREFLNSRGFLEVETPVNAADRRRCGRAPHSPRGTTRWNAICTCAWPWNCT